MAEASKFWYFNEETGELEIKEGVVGVNRICYEGLRFYNKCGNNLDRDTIKLGNIKSIKFPTSTEIIYNDTFRGCKNLEKILFSKDCACNDEKNALQIRPNAFANCNSLKKIKFDSSRGLSICGSAFEYCKNLEEVLLPRKTVIAGLFIFSGCEKLKKIYVYESTVETMPGILEVLTEGNNAETIVVDDDFEMAYEDEEEFEESSEASNEVAEIQTVSEIQTHKSCEMAQTQTVSKIQMPTSFCGVIKPNLLSNRKPGDATNFVGIPKKSKR